MTTLQLQLTEKHGFVLTKPDQADPSSVKLLEGAFSINNDKMTLNGVELATINKNGVQLNRGVLTNTVGDIHRVVQQLRFFSKTSRK